MRTLTILLLLASGLFAQESDSLQTRRAEGPADWEVPEAILVTARREFLLPERLPTPVYDLNLRDLEEQGARPLSRILETAPGVQMEGVIKGAIHLPSLPAAFSNFR
ncbi:MAG: hypothetical protein QF492_04450 [Candidatus Krumholzibacteria bacterium]|jgi:hypothetical protein|nr:hypothetical protein [Candidatus Krumholzibacteria bacterium]MDP6669143.1 hypothetical protein [Candidatus Krumholzibacteria bacterium]MDP6797544.1 hypothetical protein [Candidatus Krumholzibacteria bacterium]MDP7021311.1 hypothetical protein [Candidatus Krumholzibacteria bacterium]